MLGYRRNLRAVLGFAAVSLLPCAAILTTQVVEDLLSEREAVTEWRARGSPGAGSGLMMSGRQVPTGAGELTVLRVAGLEGHDLGWPGMQRIPPEGSMLASHGVAMLGPSTVDAVLTISGAGSVVGQAPDNLLLTHDELLVVVFVSPDELVNTSHVRIRPGEVAATVDRPNLILVAALASLVASLALIAVASQSFVRAILPTLAFARLSGMPQHLIRVVAMAPILVVSGAIALFAFTGLHIVSGLSSRFEELRWASFVASRVEFRPWVLVILLLATLCTTGLAGWLGMLRAVSDTLGAAKGHRNHRSPSLAWLSIPVVAFGLLYGVSQSQSNLRVPVMAALALGLLGGVLLLGRLFMARLHSRPGAGAWWTLVSGLLREAASETRAVFEPAVVGVFLAAMLLPLVEAVEVTREVTSSASLVARFSGPADSELGALQRHMNSQSSLDWGIVARSAVRVLSPDGSLEVLDLRIGSCSALAVDSQAIESQPTVCERDTLLLPDGFRPASVEGEKAQVGIGGTSDFVKWKESAELGSGLPNSAYWFTEDIPESDPWLVVGAESERVLELVVAFSELAPGADIFVPEERASAELLRSSTLHARLTATLILVTGLSLVAYAYGVAGFLNERRDHLRFLRSLGVARSSIVAVVGWVILMPMLLGLLIATFAGLSVGLMISDSSELPEVPWKALGCVVLVLVAVVLQSCRTAARLEPHAP